VPLLPSKFGYYCKNWKKCYHSKRCGLSSIRLAVSSQQLNTIQQVLSTSWDGRPFGHNRHGPKIGGLCPFWEGGAGSPSNMWAGLRPTSLPSGILIHPAVLATTDMGRKLGGCAPLREEVLGPHLTQCGQGRGLPPCQVSYWSIQPFGHNRHRPQIIRTQAKPAPVNFEVGGAAVPLSVGDLDPHLTQCGRGQGLTACQVSSWSLQPFAHNTPTSQTGQTDNGPIGQGEPFYKRSPKNRSQKSVVM